MKYVFGEETVATGADKKPLTKEGEKYYYTLTEADVDQRIVADSEIKYVYITTGEAGAKIEAVADTEEQSELTRTNSDMTQKISG